MPEVSSAVVRAVERGLSKSAQSDSPAGGAVVKAVERGFDRAVSAQQRTTRAISELASVVASAVDGGNSGGSGPNLGSLLTPGSAPAGGKSGSGSGGSGGGGGSRLRAGASKIGSGLKSMADPAAGLAAVSSVLVSVWGSLLSKSKALKGPMSKLKGSLGRLGVIVRKAVVPGIVVLVKGITAAINVFTNLPGPVRTALAVAAGLVSALVILTTVAITVTGAILGMQAVFGSLLVPILAVIAVVAVLYAVWQANLFGIRDITKQAVAGIASLVGTLLKFMIGRYLQVGKALLKITATMWNGIVTVAQSYLSALVKAILVFVRTTGKVWKGLTQIMQGDWKQGARTIIRAGATFARDLLKIYSNLATEVIAVVLTLTSRIATEFERLFDLLVMAGKAGMNGVVGAITDGLNATVGPLNSFLSDMERTINDAISLANQYAGTNIDTVSLGGIDKMDQPAPLETRSVTEINRSANERFQTRKSRIGDLQKQVSRTLGEQLTLPEELRKGKPDDRSGDEIMPKVDDKIAGMFSGLKVSTDQLAGFNTGTLFEGAKNLFGKLTSRPNESTGQKKQSNQSQSQSSSMLSTGMLRDSSTGSMPSGFGMGTLQSGVGETLPGQSMVASQPVAGAPTPTDSSNVGSMGGVEKQVNNVQIDSIRIRTSAKAPTTKRDTDQLANELSEAFGTKLGRRS